MPLFEYRCSECGKDFEKLVRGKVRVKCPQCGSSKIKKLFSTFGIKSGSKFNSSIANSCKSCTSSSCSSCKL